MLATFFSEGFVREADSLPFPLSGGCLHSAFGDPLSPCPKPVPCLSRDPSYIVTTLYHCFKASCDYVEFAKVSWIISPSEGSYP